MSNESSTNKTFVVDMTKIDDMDKFQELMDEIHAEQFKCVQKLSEELKVSEACAQMVYYLRSRSRWTQEKEDELIKMDHEGKELPNVFSGDF